MSLFNSYSENSLRFYPEKCVGCERCTEVCPHRVFSMHGNLASLQRPEKCMECGACARNCPEGAISVQAGVGCAWAMIRAALTGRKEITCGDDGCCGQPSEEPCSCAGAPDNDK
ncbi:MAG TPA: mercury methylation ferredoxin HgcB [Methanoregulaceae archaeon]|nr:mercury methylation ferredoxin HgcB [Methanoregulaceae archaeon]